jgi:hypothetical protein
MQQFPQFPVGDIIRESVYFLGFYEVQRVFLFWIARFTGTTVGDVGESVFIGSDDNVPTAAVVTRDAFYDHTLLNFH